MENAKKMIVIPSVSEGSLNLFERSAIGGYIAFAIDSSLFAQNDRFSFEMTCNIRIIYPKLSPQTADKSHHHPEDHHNHNYNQ